MRKKPASKSRWYSIRWFHCGFLHIKRGRIIGHSCTGSPKRLVYYRGRNAVSVSIPNFIGEFIHYDTNGNCIGYSRYECPWKIVHYSKCGDCLGRSIVFLWVLIIHSGFPVFSTTTGSRRNAPHYKWIPYLVCNILLPSELVQSIIRFVEGVLKRWS